MTVNTIQYAKKHLAATTALCAMMVGLCANFTMASTAMTNPTASTSIHMLEHSETQNWVIVNDTVMGGRSQASITHAQSYLQFSGDLSLRNNGGFASIRRIYKPVSWQANKPISIVVRGDGRNYQFRLRTNLTVNGADGVAHVKAFETVKGEWLTIGFDESDFTPQFRGRLVSGAPALWFNDITQLGFMLADGTPGGFELHVKAILQD